ncbi:YIP1 family protein [Candidatus Woesearchaeota archaeon]|nr:YIP1 family protein [Candidatus Woesearchaeota archaeon]
MKYLDTLGKALTDPEVLLSCVRHEKGIMHGFKFLAINTLISLIPLAFIGLVIVVIAITAGTNPILALLILIAALAAIYLFGIAMSFVHSGILHILALLFGGLGNYQDTYKAVAYSSAPHVFSYIPIANLAAAIWSVVLLTIWLKNLHHYETWKAVLTWLIPGLFITAIVIALELIVLSMRSSAF